MRRALPTRLLAIALLTGCWGTGNPGTAAIVPGPTRAVPLAAAPSTEPSSIHLTVTLTPQMLQDAVASNIPQVLLDIDSDPIGKGIVAAVRVERAGPPKVSTRGGTLGIDIPVSIEVEPRPSNLKRQGVALGTVTGSLVLHVELAPTVSERWDLDPHANLSHTWITPPVLKIGPLHIKVQKLVDGKLRERLAEVAQELNAELPKTIGLRQTLKRAWSNLAVPQRVQEQPPTWLTFLPRALYASDPTMNARGVHVTVGATGPISLVLADTMPAGDAGALPPRSTPPTDPTASIQAPIHLRWPILVDELRTELEGDTFVRQLPAGGTGTVTLVRLLDLYPSGEGVALGMNLVVKAMGQETQMTVWLLGTPVLDDTTLSIQDFTYTATTDSSWLNTAHAWVADSLQEELAGRLRWPLDARLVDAQRTMNAHLAGVSPSDGVAVQGAITGLALNGLHLTADALVVEAGLTGDLKVVVTSLEAP